MFSINLSKDFDYHTQRNNKYVPMASCNTTALIMALISSNISFDYPAGMQPEDYLTSLLQSKEAFDEMKKIAPWAVKDGYPPQEVHVMLEWAVNQKLVGRKVDVFTTNATIQDLLFNILKKESTCAVSGYFTKSGHIVTLVGFESKQKNIESIKRAEEIDLDKVKDLIVDDPYGNYHKDYKDYHGNNIKFSLQEFADLTKTKHSLTAKWAHMINI